MKIIRAILLMAPASAEKAISLASFYGVDLVPVVVNDVAGLSIISHHRPTLILSFGTSVIVPKKYLLDAGVLAINIHAASPEFPGRDPHHFAVYQGVRRYGATIHFMTEDVDGGNIIDVEWFDVPPKTEPIELLSKANEKAWVLMSRLFQTLGDGKLPCGSTSLNWTGEKTSRKKFHELCRVDPSISAADFERKKLAVKMPGYSNLYIELHGCRFFLKGSC